jgi:hypothetical protein
VSGTPTDLIDGGGNATFAGLAQFEEARDFVKLWDMQNSMRGVVLTPQLATVGQEEGL